MLDYVQYRVHKEELATALWSGNTIIGMDGSIKNSHGTYTFVIIILVPGDKLILACRLGGHMPMLAEYIEMDSHRPEAAALYAAHTFLGSFLLDHCNHPRPIGPLPLNACLCFVLDNKSVMTDIDWTFDVETSQFDYLKANYNIQATQQKNAALPLESSMSWVKGHQD